VETTRGRTLFLLKSNRHLPMVEFNEDSFYACFHQKNIYSCCHDNPYFSIKLFRPIRLCRWLIVECGTNCQPWDRELAIARWKLQAHILPAQCRMQQKKNATGLGPSR